MAVLYEDALRNPDKAVESWRTVLEVDDADEEALDALARLYIAASEWRELVDIYQRKIELSRDPQSLRYLRFLSARVYEEKLEEADEAASQLRAVLDANPGDADALAMLDRIFSREKQHFELLEILDLRVAGSEGPDQDALAFRAAELVEKELDDQSGAIARYRDIVSRSPGHDGARQALWKIARDEAYRLQAVAALEPVLRSTREWTELVELQELRLEVEETPGVRLEILTEIARIREQEQNDSRRAFDAWALAFAEEPSEAGPREALERLAASTNEFAKLAAVYSGRLESHLDPELEQTLSWRLAQLYEEQLGEPGKAVEFLQRIVSVPGQEAAALARLETLLDKLARYKELEEVLEREADVAVDSAAQAGFLASLGELRLSKLDNKEGAMVAFRDALERQPEHTKALAAMRALLADADLKRDVADILEPLAEARGDFAELASLYEVRVALEDSGPEKALWWRRVADVADEKLDDRERAIEALGQALKEDPSAPDTAEALERVAVAAGKPMAGAQRMEAAMTDLSGTSLVELALRAAGLYQQASGAARLTTTPRPSGCTAGRWRKSRRTPGRWSPWRRCTAARPTPSPSGWPRFSSSGAQARWTASAGRRCLPRRPASTRSWATPRRPSPAGRRCATATRATPRPWTSWPGCWACRATTRSWWRCWKTGRGSATASEERASLFFRIGELRRGPLEDSEGAATSFKEVLDIVPDDRRALEALAQLEEKRGDFAALEEVLLRRLSVVEGSERVETLLALAKNAEHRLDDNDRAASYLHQILETDPVNREAYQALTRLLERGERWYDLIELYERRATAEGQRDREAEIVCRLAIAELWGRRLNDDDSAREAIEKVLELRPKHGGALLALAAVHERAEAWAEAAEALEQAAAVSESAHDRAEVHFRRSRVLEAQGASDDQVEASLRVGPGGRAVPRRGAEGGRGAGAQAERSHTPGAVAGGEGGGGRQPGTQATAGGDRDAVHGPAGGARSGGHRPDRAEPAGTDRRPGEGRSRRRPWWPPAVRPRRRSC